MKRSHARPRANTAAEKGSEPARTRRRRPSPSNDHLLGKAFELFVELGYEGTSLEAITATAGLAKRTVYVRYQDKQALFVASIQRAIEKWILPIETLRAAETDSLEETLMSIGRLLLDNVLSPSGLRLLQLTSAVSRKLPEVGAHNVEQGTKPTLNYLAELLDRRMGFRFQSVADSAAAATAFMNLVVSGPANFLANGVPLDRVSIERYIHSSVLLFLHGVMPTGRYASPLEDENLRLKKLLADTMIQLDVAQQALRQARGSRIAINDPPETVKS